MRYESWQNFAQNYLGTLPKGGHRVQFGGTIAYTDGKLINIPSLEPGTEMTPWQQLVYHGYLDHELGHVRYTQFTDVKLDRIKEPLESYLRNLVEDIRIENRQIEEYPGSRIYLNALAQEIDKLPDKEKLKGNQAELVLSLIYFYFYTKYRTIDTNPLGKTIVDYPELQPIQELIDKTFPGVRTTRDAVKLADAICQLLPKNVDWSALTDESGPLFITVGLGDLDINGEIKPGKLAEIKAAMADAANSADQHEKRKQVILLLNDQIDVTNDDLLSADDKKKKKTTSKIKQKQGDRILPAYSVVYDKIMIPAREDLASYARIKASIAGDVLAMKKALTVYLRAKKAAAWSRGLETGKLDTHALTRLITTGDRRIMKQRRARDLLDTAVEMTIDLSGSMNQQSTAQTAVLSMEALTSIPKLKLQVTGFETANVMDFNYGDKRAANCGRSCAFNYVLFKGFDEHEKKGKARLGSLRTHSATPLGDAYATAISNLLKRKETKRVLIIVTDGDPCIPVGSRDHSEDLLMKKMFSRAKKCKIDVIGLFIGNGGSDILRQTSHLYVVVNSPSAMGPAILNLIRNRIAP